MGLKSKLAAWLLGTIKVPRDSVQEWVTFIDADDDGYITLGELIAGVIRGGKAIKEKIIK